MASHSTRALNVSEKLIATHLEAGEMKPGSEIGLRIDQTLTQDATGTLVMLELEAMGMDRVQTEISVQYVDHNLLQADHKNADDHVFLKSACEKFGVWYSRPGNGVSHPVHQERFGKPGRTLVGSDSHTPAAGALGMLALGAGGLDVAFAMAGRPLFFKMPEILGVRLDGELPDWVSAKDVILEMLRRYDVKGCVGKIVEYYGPGLASLSAMDRHVIANMGTELGATTTVFPADEQVRRFLESQERGSDFEELAADPGATYAAYDQINLSALVPLIAKPGSPGDVVPVSEVQGRAVHQAVLGSSANPGLRDFWTVARIVEGHAADERVSFDVNPTSRQVIENLSADGSFAALIAAGARFHQAGCLGCIGMGQAPASGKISLRTMPRNFPGRSGTLDDQVYLCSPETVAAAALTGKITDPRELEQRWGIAYPRYRAPEKEIISRKHLLAPLNADRAAASELQKGPNIKSLPDFEKLPDEVGCPALLKVGDNISTDEILRAGAEVLPLRSNIPEISKWAFYVLDRGFYDRARESQRRHGAHVVVAGENYAQGSSREHAAIAPRFLGQVAVLAKSYARIGWQNLINFGIVPLEFVDPSDYDRIEQGDLLRIEGLRRAVSGGETVRVRNQERHQSYEARTALSSRQRKIVLAGGVINLFKNEAA